MGQAEVIIWSRAGSRKCSGRFINASAQAGRLAEHLGVSRAVPKETSTKRALESVGDPQTRRGARRQDVLGLFVVSMRTAIKGTMDVCRCRHTHRVVAVLMLGIVQLPKGMFFSSSLFSVGGPSSADFPSAPYPK